MFLFWKNNKWFSSLYKWSIKILWKIWKVFNENFWKLSLNSFIYVFLSLC